MKDGTLLLGLEAVQHIVVEVIEDNPKLPVIIVKILVIWTSFSQSPVFVIQKIYLPDRKFSQQLSTVVNDLKCFQTLSLIGQFLLEVHAVGRKVHK